MGLLRLAVAEGILVGSGLFPKKYLLIFSKFLRVGPLNCGHLDIAAAYLGTDLKLHQDCYNTMLASDLRSPRYSILQPLLETPISAILFILQPEVMFVGVVIIKT